MRSFSPPRFDYLGKDRLDGEPEGRRQLWRLVWPRVDVAMIDGFPEWDQPVHDILHAAFPSIAAVFIAYAEGGRSSSGVAEASSSIFSHGSFSQGSFSHGPHGSFHGSHCKGSFHGSHVICLCSILGKGNTSFHGSFFHGQAACSSGRLAPAGAGGG